MFHINYSYNKDLYFPMIFDYMAVKVCFYALQHKAS